MLILAIEGPCCAGKTTLTQGIVASLGGEEAVTVVPDYADFVGGDHMPDPAPPTVPQELKAIEALLEIETRRFAASPVKPGKTRLLIIDRSALTLVGHANGLDWQMGRGFGFRSAVERAVYSDIRSVIPKSVIYVGIGEHEQARRNRGKFEGGSIFMQPRYNWGFQQFFAMPSADGPEWSQVTLDGEQPSPVVLSQGLSALAEWAPSLFEDA